MGRTLWRSFVVCWCVYHGHLPFRGFPLGGDCLSLFRTARSWVCSTLLSAILSHQILLRKCEN
jgi:hypothetical protein